MKKLYTMMLIAAMAFTFTACEDQLIADSLPNSYFAVVPGDHFIADRAPIAFNNRASTFPMRP